MSINQNSELSLTKLSIVRHAGFLIDPPNEGIKDYVLVQKWNKFQIILGYGHHLCKVCTRLKYRASYLFIR